MQLTQLLYQDILQEVCDPEIPILTVIDLGVIRNVTEENGKIIVTITPTYTGCPAMDMISVNIKSAFQDHGYNDVDIKMVLSPAWSTDWMSAEGKEKLLQYGIAPPVEKSTDKSFLLNEDKVVPCPRCQSKNTEMISLFGSTACKSLYKCLDCLEPFDYFKCH